MKSGVGAGAFEGVGSESFGRAGPGGLERQSRPGMTSTYPAREALPAEKMHRI
jgi:hypothetical protein